jgi:hypothetical protein
MANSPDIFVARKILSSKYQPYAPQGHFLRATAVKFFARLDLNQIFLFLDGHYIISIISRIIREMVEEGVIRVTGHGRGACYTLYRKDK